jgi:hypothetical protein
MTFVKQRPAPELPLELQLELEKQPLTLDKYLQIFYFLVYRSGGLHVGYASAKRPDPNSSVPRVGLCDKDEVLKSGGNRIIILEHIIGLIQINLKKSKRYQEGAFSNLHVPKYLHMTDIGSQYSDLIAVYKTKKEAEKDRDDLIANNRVINLEKVAQWRDDLRFKTIETLRWIGQHHPIFIAYVPNFPELGFYAEHIVRTSFVEFSPNVPVPEETLEDLDPLVVERKNAFRCLKRLIIRAGEGSEKDIGPETIVSKNVFSALINRDYFSKRFDKDFTWNEGGEIRVKDIVERIRPRVVPPRKLKDNDTLRKTTFKALQRLFWREKKRGVYRVTRMTQKTKLNKSVFDAFVEKPTPALRLKTLEIDPSWSAFEGKTVKYLLDLMYPIK